MKLSFLFCLALLACGGPTNASQNTTPREELLAMGALEPDPSVVWFDGRIGGVGMMNGRLLFNGDAVYAQGSLRVIVGPVGAVASAPSFVGWIQGSARCGRHWIFVSDVNVIAVSRGFLGPLQVVGRALRSGMAPHFSEDGERTLLHVGRQAFEFICEDEVVLHALPQRSVVSAARGHGMSVVVTTSAAYARRDGSTEWHRLDVGNEAVRMTYATVNGLMLRTSSGEYIIGDNLEIQASRAHGAHYSVLVAPSPQRSEQDRAAMREALQREGSVPTPSGSGPQGSSVYQRDSRWFLSDSSVQERRLPRAFDNRPVAAVDGSIWTHRQNEDGSLSDLLVLEGDEVFRRAVPPGMHFYAIQRRERLFVRNDEGTEFWQSTDGGLHWSRLGTDTRVDGLFRVTRLSRARGATCGEPCRWSNVVIGPSPPSHPNARLIGTTEWTPIARHHHADEYVACDALAQPLRGAPTSFFSRRRSQVTWHGADGAGVFRSRSRALRYSGESRDRSLWLFRETGLVQIAPEHDRLGSSLRWLRRGGREVELVRWAARITTILRPDGSGVALSDDTVMERRRAFAWNDSGEMVRERYITAVSSATVAWVDGHPAVFLTDDPWGDHLRGDVVFLDASRGTQQIDLEIRAELCAGTSEEDAALFSAPGPQRWGLGNAVFERHGDHACLRAAREDGADPWNGWVSDSTLVALAPAGRVDRVHLVPAVSQAESFRFGRLLRMNIADHCAVRDDGLAGSATVLLTRAAAPRWEDSTFSSSFERCASAQMTEFGLPEELEGARMNLTVVPKVVSLQPATCSFRRLEGAGDP